MFNVRALRSKIPLRKCSTGNKVWREKGLVVFPSNRRWAPLPPTLPSFLLKIWNVTFHTLLSEGRGKKKCMIWTKICMHELVRRFRLLIHSIDRSPWLFYHFLNYRIKHLVFPGFNHYEINDFISLYCFFSRDGVWQNDVK